MNLHMKELFHGKPGRIYFNLPGQLSYWANSSQICADRLGLVATQRQSEGLLMQIKSIRHSIGPNPFNRCKKVDVKIL